MSNTKILFERLYQTVLNDLGLENQTYSVTHVCTVCILKRTKDHRTFTMKLTCGLQSLAYTGFFK